MKNQSRFNEELSRMASYLWANGYDGKIYFDHKSYDDNRDIPHLLIDGERVLVDTFIINRDGSQFTIISGRNSYILDMDAIPSEWDDEYFEQIGMFELLRDIYYETTESYDIGDYEIDFLKK